MGFHNYSKGLFAVLSTEARRSHRGVLFVVVVKYSNHMTVMGPKLNSCVGLRNIRLFTWRCITQGSLDTQSYLRIVHQPLQP